ncbi:nociceptin receptor-like [Patella vulgata]|uniref:nociceptin receptor-like n=1 Tax=Patella vulgata TaxID=6465 RepID=UPI0024A86401|nr:nociceptin receptor-like [Patella vulgata]
MRTVTNLYLANLAAIDLLYLLSVSLAISVLTLTATSVDRYYAIIHPVRSRTTRTSRRAQTT